MKYLKPKSYIFFVLALSFFSISSAQSMCEKLITPQIEKIEASLEELKSNSEADDFDKKMEKLDRSINSTETKIKSCELKGRMSLDKLKERLKIIKVSYSSISGVPVIEEQAQPDLSAKNYLIQKMEACVFKYGNLCMKEEDKTLVRSDIEFLQNYKDDGSSYYYRTIVIGNKYLESLELNVDKDHWVKDAKTTIDHKAKSVNKELTKEYMTCFYNDLTYIQNVALPENENLKTIIAYLKNHL